MKDSILVLCCNAAFGAFQLCKSFRLHRRLAKHLLQLLLGDDVGELINGHTFGQTQIVKLHRLWRWLLSGINAHFLRVSALNGRTAFPYHHRRW